MTSAIVARIDLPKELTGDSEVDVDLPAEV